MVGRDEVERAIESARSGSERIQILGALIARATGNEVIIVGGSAIEVYTSSRTSTLDIDVVTPVAPAVRALKEWGFVPSGRVWRRKDWEIDVDLLGPNFTGSRRKIRTMVTPYGPVSIAGVEDMLIKRLVELKHWPTSKKWREELLRQIAILVGEYDDKFDEEYLAFLAKRDDVADILADSRRQARS